MPSYDRYDLCLDIIYMLSVLICFGVYNIILNKAAV